MSLTFAQASDQILARLKEAWDSTGYNLVYDNVREQKQALNVPWAMALVRHGFSNQSSLGGVGHRTFSRLGILVVTIHTPSSSGLSDAYILAKVVTDAFEGVSMPNGVWFRNVRINELGREDAFYQTNVLINFEYTETK